jgi:hypothetical protein
MTPAGVEKAKHAAGLQRMRQKFLSHWTHDGRAKGLRRKRPTTSFSFRKALLSLVRLLAVVDHVAFGFNPGTSFRTGFSAITFEGKVNTWPTDSSAVSSSLESDMSVIYSTGSAFAALKSDGSVIK